MTIEATLQSIDASLKKLVELAEKAPAAAPVKPPRATKEADKAPAKEPEKAPEPKTNEPDPFDDTPSAKPVTKDEVRAALVAYQGATSKEATMKLLGEHGATSIGTLFEKGTQQALFDAVKKHFGDKFDAAIAGASKK
jgi:hypothetical protein